MLSWEQAMVIPIGGDSDGIKNISVSMYIDCFLTSFSNEGWGYPFYGVKKCLLPFWENPIRGGLGGVYSLNGKFP